MSSTSVSQGALQAAFAFCVTMCLAACGNSATTVPTDEYTANRPVPSEFRMVLGEGGGFAGRWSGYTIEMNRVVYWEGMTAEANPRDHGRLDSLQLQALWDDLLETNGLLATDAEPVGNYTAFIEISTPRSTFKSSWTPGVQGQEAPRSPVEALYRRTRAALDSLAATGTTESEL